MPSITAVISRNDSIESIKEELEYHDDVVGVLCLHRERVEEYRAKIDQVLVEMEGTEALDKAEYVSEVEKERSMLSNAIHGM